MNTMGSCQNAKGTCPAPGCENAKLDTRFEDAFQEVRHELEEATRQYSSFRTAHEGYAILLEEVDELWDEIKKKPTERDSRKLRAEAKQVAAMALRFMIDLT